MFGMDVEEVEMEQDDELEVGNDALFEDLCSP